MPESVRLTPSLTRDDEGVPARARVLPGRSTGAPQALGGCPARAPRVLGHVLRDVLRRVFAGVLRSGEVLGHGERRLKNAP